MITLRKTRSLYPRRRQTQRRFRGRNRACQRCRFRWTACSARRSQGPHTCTAFGRIHSNAERGTRNHGMLLLEIGAGTGAAGSRFSVVVGSSRQRHRGTALSKLHMNHSSESRLPRHGESVPVRSAVAARRNSAGDETRGPSTPCRHAASDAIPSRTWQRTRPACSADCAKREFCGSGWRPSL